MYVSNCERLIKEVHLKTYSQRNKPALIFAEEAATASVKILEDILGDKANYLVARAMLGVGDVQI